MSHAEIEETWGQLQRFREGAHYCRMDLHTHSPASECSSYDLPDALEAALPAARGELNRSEREAIAAFLHQLSDRGRVLDGAWAEACGDALGWMPAVPVLPRLELIRVAEVWLADVRRLDDACGPETAPLLRNAVRDVESLLQRSFFPPEYVLRCHIEELEVVALTDHNHPGWIVPRLPELGTWFGALCDVNVRFVDDIQDPESGGAQVRTWIRDRLAAAEQRLAAGQERTRRGEETTRKLHADPGRSLRALADRLEHVRERAAHWTPEDAPVRALTVLPGTEITVSDIHCLTVFPPQWYVPGRIANILSAIGIPEWAWGRGFEAAAVASVQATIDLVHAAGGVAIPAHANSDFKGLLRLFRRGLALTKVLEHPALLALETLGGTVISGAGRKHGRDACETLRWLDSDAHAPQRAKMLAFVKGSDAHECRLGVDGTGEDLGSRFTWVKLDLRPNDRPDEVFRALRLALLGGQNRLIEHPTEDTFNYAADRRPSRNEYCIRREDRVQLLDWRRNHPAILGLSVRGGTGYVGDVAIRFNPFLNCVVGPGGKSTVLRLLAWGLGSLQPSAAASHAWLPEVVRVFVRDGETLRCVERSRRGGAAVAPSSDVRLLRLRPEGGWEVELEGDSPALERLGDQLTVWPDPRSLDTRDGLPSYTSADIDRLVALLDPGPSDPRHPLLVHQPREIFDSADLFQRVLRRPTTKLRQVIWATGSPNVPTALDAEKIIVTDEKVSGGDLRMWVVCGGDLHEDEIVHSFLDRMEGGWNGFARRLALYTA